MCVNRVSRTLCIFCRVLFMVKQLKYFKFLYIVLDANIFLFYIFYKKKMSVSTGAVANREIEILFARTCFNRYGQNRCVASSQ